MKLGIGFWSLYAKVYDTLRGLQPYDSMLADVVGELRLPPGARVLDAGCGSGNLTRKLLDAGYQVVAVDSSEGMLQRARGKCPRADCTSADLDAPLPFGAETFDAVVCSNVLYSLPSPKRTLLELKRVVRSGGKLVVSNPVEGFSMGEILARHWRSQNALGRLGLLARIPALALLIAFNVLLLRRQRAGLFFFYGPDQLGSVIREAGFDEIRLRPTYADQGLLACAERN